MTEEEFMTYIISEICDFAIDNQMEPDDTLSTIADNITNVKRKCYILDGNT